MGCAPKLKSSKSRASGGGGSRAASEGRVKASVLQDSQSNEDANNKGSETLCRPRAQSNPLGFLTAGPSEWGSDEHRFRAQEREVSSLRGGRDDGSW